MCGGGREVVGWWWGSEKKCFAHTQAVVAIYQASFWAQVTELRIFLDPKSSFYNNKNISFFLISFQ